MQIRGRTIIKAVAYSLLAWEIASKMGWDEKIKATVKDAVGTNGDG